MPFDTGLQPWTLQQACERKKSCHFFEWSAKSQNIWICAMCFMIWAQKLVITVAVYYAAMKLRCVKCASGCEDKVIYGARLS